MLWITLFLRNLPSNLNLCRHYAFSCFDAFSLHCRILCQRKHLQNNAFYMFKVCSISCSFEETKHFFHAKSIETRWRSFPSSPGPTTNLVKVWVWTLWGNPELNCEHQSLWPPVNKTKNLSFCVFFCNSVVTCFINLNSADKKLQCVFENNASRWTQPRHHGEPGLVAFGFRSLLAGHGINFTQKNNWTMGHRRQVYKASTKTHQHKTPPNSKTTPKTSLTHFEVFAKEHM